MTLVDVLVHLGCDGSCGMSWLMWIVVTHMDVVATVGCGAASCVMWWLIWDVMAFVRGGGGLCGI